MKLLSFTRAAQTGSLVIVDSVRLGRTVREVTVLLLCAIILIVVSVGLLLSGRTSPLVVFPLLPIVVALALGQSFAQIGAAIMKGLTTVWPNAVMFAFAVLFFGVLRERGLFDPLVRWVVGNGRTGPVALYVSTVLVCALVHLDGVGAATLLIAIPALLPLYRRSGLDPLRLLLFAGIPMGIVNLVPWGGPTARAASALGTSATDLWLPMLPVQLIGLAAAFGLAVLLGVRDARALRGAGLPSTGSRAGALDDTADAAPLPGRSPQPTPSSSRSSLATRSGASQGVATVVSEGTQDRRSDAVAPDGGAAQLPGTALPGVATGPAYWVNVALLVAVLAALFTSLLPLPAVFVVGFGLAAAINFRRPEEQLAALERHAAPALGMAAVLFAVAVFVGVLQGTGMMTALTSGLTSMFPPSASGWVHLGVGVLGVPLGLVIGPDPYYFGLLPVVAEVAAAGGIPPIDTARAMLIGENLTITLSPVIPAAYLAAGLAGVDLVRHIRRNVGWMLLIALIMLAASVGLGVIGI